MENRLRINNSTYVFKQLNNIISVYKPLSDPISDSNQSAWAKADRACWGARPAKVSAMLQATLDQLYAIRQPINAQPNQLIHADCH